MKILLTYKKSAYKIYFLERQSSLYQKQRFFKAVEIKRFKDAHEAHYKTLDLVEKILADRKISYDKMYRGRKIDMRRYDLVITVGGDGTFLEAARTVKKQLILGVNSDPERSIGRLCGAKSTTFARTLDAVIEGVCKVVRLQRIRLKVKVNHENFDINVLNDLLIAHRNPAALSRYYFSIGGKREEHRSSGLWIATAAGSTGAICSAGCKPLPIESRKILYKPRELYAEFNPSYHFQGGVLQLKKTIMVESLMRSGVIFVDGANFNLPFTFGNKVFISNSPDTLRVVRG